MVEKKKTPKKKTAPARAAKAAPKKVKATTPRKVAKAPKRAKGPRHAPKPAVTASRPQRKPVIAAGEGEGAPSPEATLAAASRGLGIHDVRPAWGSTHYRKRVGRGPGSGHGKTAGRGSKGQKSRSGYRHMRGFEGGQMPLHRRLPKRGFTNIFRVVYDVVNLSDLDRFESGSKVTPALLASQRLAHGRRPVKILGDGEVGKPLEVSAHKFSASAQAKIEAAGGRCEVIPR